MSDGDRRTFLRSAFGLGVLGAVATPLVSKSLELEDCIGDGACKICLSQDGCELPPAVSFREIREKSRGVRTGGGTDERSGT